MPVPEDPNSQRATAVNESYGNQLSKSSAHKGRTIQFRLVEDEQIKQRRSAGKSPEAHNLMNVMAINSSESLVHKLRE
jgi:hypothetical protein